RQQRPVTARAGRTAARRGTAAGVGEPHGPQGNEKAGNFFVVRALFLSPFGPARVNSYQGAARPAARRPCGPTRRRTPRPPAHPQECCHESPPLAASVPPPLVRPRGPPPRGQALPAGALRG